MSKEELGRAFTRRKIAFLGDSILRNIFCELIRLFEPNIQLPLHNAGSLRILQKLTKKVEKKTEGRTKYWRYSNFNFQIDIFYAHSTLLSQNLIRSRFFDLGSYTDIVISNAVWDMGISFRGHEAYYEALSDILTFLDEKQLGSFRTRKNTILLGLHYINTTLCTSEKCKICNHDLIQNYVRESQKKAVMCLRSPILIDSFQFTNTFVANMNSHDGVHPSAEISRLQAELILQAILSETKDCPVFLKGQIRQDCKATGPALPRSDLKHLQKFATSEAGRGISCLERNPIDNLYIKG